MNHTVQKPSLSVSLGEFEQLAAFQDLYCVSICLPSSSNNRIPMQEIEKEILKQAELANYTSQVYGLTREAIWEHLKDVKNIIKLCADKEPELSLIIFISRLGVNSFFIPLTKEFFVYVNDHFYLKPLTQLFNDDRKLIMLHLKRESAELIFEEKTIPQYSISIKNENYESINKEKDWLDYFKKIIDQLKSLTKSNTPKVLAGKKEIVTPFLGATESENYFQRVLYLPEETNDPRLLKRKAWRALTDFQEERVNKYLNSFAQNQNVVKDTISADMDEIILQASKGKVKTLFLARDKDVYGEFDRKNDFIISNLPKKEGASLSNLAAIHTAINSGNVYQVEMDKMPVSLKPINAIFTQKI